MVINEAPPIIEDDFRICFFESFLLGNIIQLSVFL
jgi:hypothetical protein